MTGPAVTVAAPSARLDHLTRQAVYISLADFVGHGRAERELTIRRIDGREVAVSNPQKVYFPEAGYTKLDVVRYYLAVAEGALRGVRGRPMALKRFVDGIAKEPFFQKRAPSNLPDWMLNPVWMSDNSSVAEVNRHTGEIQAHAKGKAVIYAYAVDDKGQPMEKIFAKCTVKVK
mgnify:CR=1 FL=1